MLTRKTRLTQAKVENSNYVLQLANNSLVRKMSFTQNYISKEEHQRWFETMLATNKPFFIAYDGNTPCGYIRFNSSSNESTISIAVDSAFRNRGIGTEMIQSACLKVLATTKTTKIVAHIKSENTGSIKAFTEAFFVEIKRSSDNKSVILEYPAYDEFSFRQ